MILMHINPCKAVFTLPMAVRPWGFHAVDPKQRSRAILMFVVLAVTTGQQIAAELKS
jgi:hypothetical protein